MGKKFEATTIALIVILSVRFLGQILWIISGFMSEMENIDLVSTIIAGSLIATAYLISLLGVSLKRKWGSISAMVIAGIDLIFALLVGGFSGLGAGVVDIVLIFLAYREYKQLSESIDTT